MLNRKSKGFTLIELLIVVAIIGIIAAIAIPNLLNAIDRGKQKRTMADLRSIGTAVEAYSVDTNFYPTATAMSGSGSLQTVLEPTYIKKLPLTDGWNTAMTFQPGSTSGAGYTVKSNGKGGQAQSSPTGGKTTNFTDDIIFVDGQFVQWPEGVQN
jgi:general secretion pathway protein G